MKSQRERPRTSSIATYSWVLTVGSLWIGCACDKTRAGATDAGAGVGATDGAAAGVGATAGGGASGGIEPAAGAGAGGAGSEPAQGGGQAGAPLSIDGRDWVELLDVGVWLVGWAGAFFHYSWLRFTPDAPGALQGTFEIRDVECNRCVAYLACAGAKGSYSVSDGALHMTYPPDCALDPRRWSFGEQGEPLDGLTRDALAVWHVTPDEGDAIDAYLYDASRCDPEFSTCGAL